MKSLMHRGRRQSPSSLSGPSLVDFLVMAALVVVVCLTACHAIGTNAKTTLDTLKARFGES